VPATACIGDIAIAAGATTLEGTLAVAETVSTVADIGVSASTAMGIGAGGISTAENCARSGWGSQECTDHAIGTGVDLLSFGVGRVIPWWSVAKVLTGIGSAEFDLSYPWFSSTDSAGNAVVRC
jgi:hypothetical protein